MESVPVVGHEVAVFVTLLFVAVSVAVTLILTGRSDES